MAQRWMKIWYRIRRWLVSRSVFAWCSEPGNEIDLDAVRHSALWYLVPSGKHAQQSLELMASCQPPSHMEGADGDHVYARRRSGHPQKDGRGLHLHPWPQGQAGQGDAHL